MTVLQLKCFLAVCETKKYSLAAQQMRMTQSALSKQLKALEDEFSVAVFCWDNKKLQLTEAGNVLYAGTGQSSSIQPANVRVSMGPHKGTG